MAAQLGGDTQHSCTVGASDAGEAGGQGLPSPEELDSDEVEARVLDAAS